MKLKRIRANLQMVCLTLFALGFGTQNSHANTGSQFGPAVDAFCTDFNGSTPFSDQSCDLCHTGGFGNRREPEWTWWEDGDQSGDFSPFCGSAPTPAPNAPPSASNDSASTAAGTPVTVDVLANDADADATDTLSVASVTPGSNGTATTDGSAVTYMPNDGFTGTDSFSYTVSDGSTQDHTVHGHDHAGLSDSADVTVTVNADTPANSPPRITSTPASAATVGASYRYDVQASDPDSDVLVFSLDASPTGMTIDAGSGLIEWTPSSDQTGTHDVTVRAEDGGGLSDTQSFNVSVEDATTPTVCTDDDGDLFSPDGGICGPIDCNDGEASVNPGADEQCGDGVDNDCDAALDGADSECNGGDCLDELFGGASFVVDKTTVNSEWRQIDLPDVCTAPVVIAGPPTSRDAQPGVLRLRNVGPSGFQVRFQEWEYLDGPHDEETVAYLVLQSGQHAMDDGSIWEAGTFSLGGTGKWAAQSFTKPFAGTPALFLTVQTVNGGQPVTVRARGVSAEGFEAALFEEQALMDGHATEVVGYVAIYSDREQGSIEIEGEQLTYNLETASANHRFTAVLGGAQAVKLEEEQSADAEVSHDPEDVSVLELNGLLFAQDVSSRDPDTVAIRSRVRLPDGDEDTGDTDDTDNDPDDDSDRSGAGDNDAGDDTDQSDTDDTGHGGTGSDDADTDTDEDSDNTRATGSAASLVAAVLPTSRSVSVGTAATVFATVINAGDAAATECSISPRTSLPGEFHYQTTESETNALVGTPDTPVDIAAGASQSFVVSITPSAPLAPTSVALDFSCRNTGSAVIHPGLNTILLSASMTPVPDVVALAATPSNDGVAAISAADKTGVFAVATANVGAAASGMVTAEVDTGEMPVTVMCCETDPQTAKCKSGPARIVSLPIEAGATRTFSFFVTASGNVPFDPARHRAIVTFRDASGVIRGATSVAVSSSAP